MSLENMLTKQIMASLLIQGQLCKKMGLFCMVQGEVTIFPLNILYSLHECILALFPKGQG